MGRLYQGHKMAAAKFSLKAQSLITPVYGALTSAWKGEISEQGSKKGKENLQRLRRGSPPQGHQSGFPVPLPPGGQVQRLLTGSRTVEGNASPVGRRGESQRRNGPGPCPR